MDALKLIAQDSMKAEVPNIEIGDTIKSTLTFARRKRKNSGV